jgi:hypothetical protein
MGKRKSKSCLVKILSIVGVVSLVLIAVWLGFIWKMEADVEHLPPKIFLPFTHYPAMVLKDCGEWEIGSGVANDAAYGDVVRHLEGEDSPASGRERAAHSLSYSPHSG